jgi:hypothetical protein
MAKRVPPDEKPYRPVDAALVGSVLTGPPPAANGEALSELHSDSEAMPSQRRGRAVALASDAAIKAAVPHPASTPAVERLVRMKRVLLTPSEDRELERLVQAIGDNLQTPVKFSHVIRACVSILRHSEKEIGLQAQRTGPMRRPANEDPVALAEFEHRLSQVLHAGIRTAPTIR